jgi:hypothetical protein
VDRLDVVEVPVKRVALVLLGASLVLTVTVSASAGGRHANATPVQKAEGCIRAALRKEDLAIKYIKEGKVSEAIIAFAVTAPALEDVKCAINATRAAGALDEITPTESKDAREDLHAAAGWDATAHHQLQDHHVQLAMGSVEHATKSKEKALAALEKATAPPPTTTTTGALTSPADSGPIQVTTVKCYANGTGGNPERDADFSVNGALWHLQQVYPASYVPGGSATAPLVFIEDQPSPYNEPGIHIYAGFGVTVPGDISTISSGQQVNVDSSLVDAKGNAIAGSHLKVSFKCP